MFIMALNGFCSSVALDISDKRSSIAQKGGLATQGSEYGTKDDTTMMTVGDLVSRLNTHVEGLNLLEMVQYLKDSKLARKVPP